MINQPHRPLIYTGTHIPAHAHALPRAMISINRLQNRVGDFAANHWVLDSGAFTRLSHHRPHLPPQAYADQAARWASCGTLDAVVTQDYMCEPHIIALTGLSVPIHQDLTTTNYLILRQLLPQLYVMPVIQGFHPQDYAEHTAHLSPYLPPSAWTGVGSLCKRQGTPARISAILSAITSVRPDLRLHGFGVKTTALRQADIWHRLHSTDSAAWSYAARRRGNPKDRNSLKACLAWTHQINDTTPVPSQMALI